MAKLKPGMPTTMNVGEVRVCGRINVGGTGAVSSINGDGFSAARAAAGKYTITLKKPFKKMVGFSGSILYASSASIDKLVVKVADESYTDSTPTFVLLTEPGDSTTIADPASGDAILFEAIFLESRVSV